MNGHNALKWNKHKRAADLHECYCLHAANHEWHCNFVSGWIGTDDVGSLPKID